MRYRLIFRIQHDTNSDSASSLHLDFELLSTPEAKPVRCGELLNVNNDAGWIFWFLCSFLFSSVFFFLFVLFSRECVQCVCYNPQMTAAVCSPPKTGGDIEVIILNTPSQKTKVSGHYLLEFNFLSKLLCNRLFRVLNAFVLAPPFAIHVWKLVLGFHVQFCLIHIVKC